LKNIFAHTKEWYIWGGSGASTPYTTIISASEELRSKLRGSSKEKAQMRERAFSTGDCFFK
jgi:hypothetical protein